MLLNFAGGVLVTGTAVFVINAFVGALPVSRSAKLVVVAMIGLWVGLQVALASAGLLGEELVPRVPVIGVMILIPPLLAGLAAWQSPAVRTALLALPMPLLIGLNGTRLVGVFFVLLALEGRMSGLFPDFAGWGDIVTALLAIPLTLLVIRRAAGALTIAAWNTLGLVDLILAIVLGTISFNGGLGPIPAGVGSSEIETLPWSTIPTVIVPLLIVMHAVIYAQVLVASRRKLAVAAE
jgi:hypothetical protein